AGATMAAWAVDDEGRVPYELENQLRQASTAAFIYTIPTFQNPTGQTMSAARREQIVAIAQQANVTLFEDDPYGLIRFEGESLPALFDLTGKESIYSSSFSKTVAPGLRVGWFILPEGLAAEITEPATSTYITPVLLAQATVPEFIPRGLAAPNLRRVHGLLQARAEAVLAALGENLAAA